MARQDSATEDADFEVYKTLRDFEQHFNQTQVEVKKLASAWMLATFAAVAFIVRGELAGRSLLDNGSLLVVIGLAGNIGLLSLWILDQQVNQPLIGAAFRVGMLLERSNPRLPPIRSKMWLNSRSHGVGRFHSFFYVCPMAFNLGAAIYGVLQSPPHRAWWLWFGVVAAAAALLGPAAKWLVGTFTSSSGAEAAAIRRTVADWEISHGSCEPHPDHL